MKVGDGHPRLQTGVLRALGAVSVTSKPKDWQCPHHEGKVERDAGVHVYADGDEACTPCALRFLLELGEVVPDAQRWMPIDHSPPAPPASAETEEIPQSSLF